MNGRSGSVDAGGLDAAAQDGGFDAPPVAGVETPCPPPVPVLRMHLDGDRDGSVDADTTGLDAWRGGRGNKGAIILANVDDDNADHTIDNENASVDGADDVPDLAPLALRRDPPGTPFPSGYRAFLSVSPAGTIRIFDQRAAGGAQIIAPTTPQRFEIPNLAPQEILYGMEAMSFPSTAFNGIITLTLEVQNPSGAVVSTQRAEVRVAPWVMPNHLNETERVFVVDLGADNRAFRTLLSNAVTGAGAPAPMEATGSSYAADVWMQDVMELGFATMPRVESPAAPERWHMAVVMRTANDRAVLNGGQLDRFPRAELLGRDFGFVEPQRPMAGSSLDSFGNLECSPPVTVNGREFKFGRIVFGADPARPMQPAIVRFFTSQRVQEPFPIDTSWLDVGHVDEILSFCPMRTVPKRFKLVLASPAFAMQILRDLHNRRLGGAPMFQFTPSSFPPGYSFDTSVYTMRTPDQVLGNRTFSTLQDTIQRRIDGIEVVLRTNLGLDPSDVIKLPVLFRESRPGFHVAYTPGVVNMLVVTRANQTAHLCIPKPFGPVVNGACQFERNIDILLRPTGNTFEFIDDFAVYHQGFGEIHCGTNSKRKPPTNVFWWEQPGI